MKSTRRPEVNLHLCRSRRKGKQHFFAASAQVPEKWGNGEGSF